GECRARHRRRASGRGRCLLRRRNGARPEGPGPHPCLRRGRAPRRRRTSGGSVMTVANTFRSGPDERGFFGLYGGRFVAETLMPLILDLEQAYEAAKNDPAFAAELADLSVHYAGRPSPLYYAERLTEHLGGAKIYFKRDEL